MKLKHFLTIAFMAVFLFSCENSVNSPDNSSTGGETKISYYNSDDSHNTGTNCMNCHKNGGSGEGWFQVAGSVYDSLASRTMAGGTIKLYTQSNGGGTLVKTIQVDTRGNFYTTEAVNFSGGLYPVLISANNSIKYMPQSTTTGSCNSCHDGTSQRKIWSK